jgi:hypothetical protein
MKTKKLPSARAEQQFSRVKAAFILKGTSFNAWCIENGIDTSSAYKAMLGKWSGEKGKALRVRIIEASKAKTIKTEPQEHSINT